VQCLTAPWLLPDPDAARRFAHRRARSRVARPAVSIKRQTPAPCASSSATHVPGVAGCGAATTMGSAGVLMVTGIKGNANAVGWPAKPEASARAAFMMGMTYGSVRWPATAYCAQSPKAYTLARRCLQVRIHHHAALADQARRRSQGGVGAQADGAEHCVGLHALAVGQRDRQLGVRRVVDALAPCRPRCQRAPRLQCVMQRHAGRFGQQGGRWAR